ncbi:MAG TPA: UbiA family prenyltransferase [Lacipirellulaceae bacterium]|jgi:4-hydroxybenzoate polyprenyltransferase|nr:UbiA family prenyltransferase [Lacipirellulaceae bacterium]
MRRLVFLIQVSRPIVWPVLPLVYYLGLHAANARLSIAAIVQMASLTLPMNLIGCGLNDLYDYESDRRSQRRRKVWGAVVDDAGRPLIWRAAALMAPIVLLAAAATGNTYNMAATVCLVLVAWLYSVPPVRLKERPPLDSLVNGLGYFLLPLVMGYSLGHDPRTMPLRYYLLALCVCGVHALASAADYEADTAAGHRTLAVRFGRRAAAACAFAAFLVTWLAADFHSAAVRTYLAGGTLASLAAMAFPQDRVISLACIAIFSGFLIAGACHAYGW